MLEEIRNFLPLTDNLLTGGMPSARQLADLSRAGVKMVINLAVFDPDRDLADEGTLVSSLGMQYRNIPVDWEHPTRQNLEDFMDDMDALAARKVFVHCRGNKRVSAFVALYRVLRLGWKQQAAFADVRRIWDPKEEPVWQRFIEEHVSSKPDS